MIRVYNTKEDEVFNIPMTLEAARSPQILSSFMKRSQTLSHDPLFFYTAFHDSCGLSIRKESAVHCLCCWSRALSEHQEGKLPPAYVSSKMSSACHPQDPPPIPGQPESSAISCKPKDPFSIDSQPKGPLPLIASQRARYH